MLYAILSKKAELVDDEIVTMDRMQRVILLHGTAGHPCVHWLPWLQRELQDRGVEVVAPWLPTPEGQHRDTWFAILDEEIGELCSSDILVGHSAGACFILSILERSTVVVAAAHLVAGFHELLPEEELNCLIRSFVFHGFDWGKIQAATRVTKVYHGDDDPFVPLELALRMAEQLQVTPHIIPGGQHLNTDSGFSEFPYLLDSIID